MSWQVSNLADSKFVGWINSSIANGCQKSLKGEKAFGEEAEAITKVPGTYKGVGSSAAQ
jgi:hypothetical protein